MQFLYQKVMQPVESHPGRWAVARMECDVMEIKLYSLHSTKEEAQAAVSLYMKNEAYEDHRDIIGSLALARLSPQYHAVIDLLFKPDAVQRVPEKIERVRRHWIAGDDKAGAEAFFELLETFSPVMNRAACQSAMPNFALLLKNCCCALEAAGLTEHPGDNKFEILDLHDPQHKESPTPTTKRPAEARFEPIADAPHGRCNWVDDVMVVGGAPKDYAEYKNIIDELLPAAIVRLMHDQELKGARPYWKGVGQQEALVRHVALFDFPIPNGGTVPDERLEEFVDALVLFVALNPGQCIYMHCMGGVGRAGTVAAVYLGKRHNLTAEEALKRVNEGFQARPVKWGKNKDASRTSPETDEQRAQVTRILSKMSTK